jgi:DNA modification methylase
MLEIAYRPLKGLVPYAKNARLHPATQISKIVGSLAEFGWTNPMLVADNVMIAGHGRLTAALLMAEKGIEIPRNPDPWVGPTVDLSHLDKNQRAAYVITDNRTALDGTWDQDLLSEELGWLSEEGFNIEVTGFGDDELAALLGGTLPGAGSDPDDIPETPVHPVTQPGDVWLLGKHRLICGDSTEPTTVRLVLNGVQPHLMTTDPPYGVDYDPADRGKARNADGKLLSVGMKRAVGKVQNDDVADWKAAYEQFPGDVAYVWHAAINPGVAQKNLEDAGFEIRMQIIWAKSNFVVSRGHYHMQHEPCFYCVRKNKTAHWAGDRKQSTLWQIDKAPKNMTGHSTEKPVECMLRPIENNSSVGQAVYDPFVGSGTTVIACEMSGRACYAIELKPAFVDVAVKRWQNFTLGAAVLEETGKTFEETAAERPFDGQLP